MAEQLPKDNIMTAIPNYIASIQSAVELFPISVPQNIPVASLATFAAFQTLKTTYSPHWQPFSLFSGSSFISGSYLNNVVSIAGKAFRSFNSLTVFPGVSAYSIPEPICEKNQGVEQLKAPICANNIFQRMFGFLFNPVDIALPLVSSSTHPQGNIDPSYEVDWLDIPTEDCRMTLGTQRSELESVNRMISEYHALEKSSEKTLHERIAKLNGIKSHLEMLADQPEFKDQRSTILLYNKVVEKKKNYLQEIVEFPSEKEIAEYHKDLSKLTDSRYGVLPLRNNRTYSLKMKETYGQFWLETMDPCHRRLANYYQHWLDTNPSKTDYKSFFLWLESQSIPKFIPFVEYFTDTKMKGFHVGISNGTLLHSATNKPLSNDPAKRNIYIITLSKELYIATHQDGYWHNSLSRGKSVLGAGLLHVQEGLIKKISFESGHYLPSLEQSFQSLSILRERGARFHDAFEVVYFENRNKYKIRVSSESLTDFGSFNRAIHDEAKREKISDNEF